MTLQDGYTVGYTVLAAAGHDGTIWLWDLAAGNAIGQSPGAHFGAVHAVTAVPIPGGRTALASGLGDSRGGRASPVITVEVF